MTPIEEGSRIASIMLFPEFIERMRQELHKLAATGKTNTKYYTGAMTRPRP